MRALKSVKKLPRPSIDNPRLVKRMKSTATMKKPTFRVDKILLASSASFKHSGDQKKEGSEEEEEEEAASSGGIMARAKSKSKLHFIHNISLGTSFRGSIPTKLLQLDMIGFCRVFLDSPHIC